MREVMENSDIPPESTLSGDEAVPSRRKMLALGAAGVSAALTIRPAFAQTAPAGLLGLLRKSQRLFGEIAFSSSAGVILKPFSWRVSTITAVARESCTMPT